MLLSSPDTSADGQPLRERVKARLTDAETRLRQHQAAIAAGVDPAALVDVISDVQAERSAAKSELDSIPEPKSLTDAEIYAMIDSLGDVGAVLKDARPAGLSRLYESLRLELRYEPGERAVRVTASPRSANDCVRGGIRTPVRGQPPGFREVSHASRIPARCRWQRLQAAPVSRPGMGGAAWRGVHGWARGGVGRSWRRERW
jgi:hypothetical protein